MPAVCEYEFDGRAADYLRDKCEAVAKAIVDACESDRVPMRPVLVAAICAADGFPAVMISEAAIYGTAVCEAERIEFARVIAARGEVLIALATAYTLADPVAGTKCLEIASAALGSGSRRLVRSPDETEWMAYGNAYASSVALQYLAAFVHARRMIAEAQAERGQDASDKE